jgi:hypothetical protein
VEACRAGASRRRGPEQNVDPGVISPWCPLPTISVSRAKIAADRSSRNGDDEQFARSNDTGSGPARPDVHPDRPAAIPALAGIGAGAIHAAAIGTHLDHLLLANALVVVAVTQLCTGVALLTLPGRAVAETVVVVNAAAVAAWLVSRIVGVWFVAGLEVAERPGFADSVCAGLGALAALGAAVAIARDTRSGCAPHWATARARDLALPAIAVALLTLPSMSLVGEHSEVPHLDTDASTVTITSTQRGLLLDEPVTRTA